MQVTHCPICKSPIDLQAIIADEDARELTRITLSLDRALASALINYVGLFRPEKSKLSNSRTLSLINEVQALCNDAAVLTSALTQTYEQIIEQRNRNGYSRMGGHGYLHKVIKTEAAKVKPEYVYVSRQEQMGFATGKASVEIKNTGGESKAENQRKYEEQMRRLGNG